MVDGKDREQIEKGIAALDRFAEVVRGLKAKEIESRDTWLLSHASPHALIREVSQEMANSSSDVLTSIEKLEHSLARERAEREAKLNRNG